MSEASTAQAAPRTRRRWWLLLLILLIPAVILGVALMQEPGEPGKRMVFTFPGESAAAVFAPATTVLEITPELRAGGLQAELGVRLGSIEQTFIVRNELSQQQLTVTAGNQPVRTGDLKYKLFDAAGVEISSGRLWPNVTLAPNKKGEVIIGDFELGPTVKIVLSK
jgi:hypothetical protein